jgi:toxin-antitoxin system PIN domain toxin
VRALFDVNVLLALFDRAHVHHHTAIRWWVANANFGWASCPLTQNGYLRVASQGSYSKPVPIAQAIRILRMQIDEGSHEFWHDDLSMLDETFVDRAHLLGPRQITDIYLLALAVKNSGRLVTLDTSISLRAVKGARREHLVVVP